jgi:hypothetical protein
MVDMELGDLNKGDRFVNTGRRGGDLFFSFRGEVLKEKVERYWCGEDNYVTVRFEGMKDPMRLAADTPVEILTNRDTILDHINDG